MKKEHSIGLGVLRYFLAVCEAKNISTAAETLHISQPSLSRQLKNLEAELVVTLFYRGHQEITLTQEGYYLQEHAIEKNDLKIFFRFSNRFLINDFAD